jgi:hypothetical protein
MIQDLSLIAQSKVSTTVTQGDKVQAIKRGSGPNSHLNIDLAAPSILIRSVKLLINSRPVPGRCVLVSLTASVDKSRRCLETPNFQALALFARVSLQSRVKVDHSEYY